MKGYITANETWSHNALDLDRNRNVVTRKIVGKRLFLRRLSAIMRNSLWYWHNFTWRGTHEHPSMNFSYAKGHLTGPLQSYSYNQIRKIHCAGFNVLKRHFACGSRHLRMIATCSLYLSLCDFHLYVQSLCGLFGSEYSFVFVCPKSLFLIVRLWSAMKVSPHLLFRFFFFYFRWIVDCV